MTTKQNKTQTTTKAKKKRKKRHRNQVLPEAVVVGLRARVAVTVSHETRGGERVEEREGKETRGAATAAPDVTSARSSFPFSSLLRVCECACLTARTHGKFVEVFVWSSFLFPFFFSFKKIIITIQPFSLNKNNGNP
jgi:hypothetical protein